MQRIADLLPTPEYISLNPDAYKATPPRFGSLKRVKDPFKARRSLTFGTSTIIN